MSISPVSPPCRGATQPFKLLHLYPETDRIRHARLDRFPPTLLSPRIFDLQAPGIFKMVPFVLVQILGDSLRAADTADWIYLADHNNVSFSKYLTRQNKASVLRGGKCSVKTSPT